MEWNERLAAVRKTAGLTQEQLGELAGVTRQAVSKWESGQAVPDALTIARICRALRVSADYVLLGLEAEPAIPEQPAPQWPDICPACGRPAGGTICPGCGYHLPATPPRGGRFALIGVPLFSFKAEALASGLIKYCGMTEKEARDLTARMRDPQLGVRFLLRRDLTDDAALWIATHIREDYSQLLIVEDCGEEEGALLYKPSALELPPPPGQGIGFWGIVAAVIVALLILSFL